MKHPDEDKEILAALALDALDEADARLVAARIADDAALARELEAWREIAAHLVCAAPAVEPSPECRDKILTAIKKTVKNSFSENGASAEKVFAGKTAIATIEFEKTNAVVAAPKSNVIQFAARRSFASYAPLAGAIAASIIAVALAVLLADSSAQIQSAKQEVAALNQRLNDAEQRLNETAARLERARQEREIIASPNSVVRALNGTGNVPTAKARLILDPKTKRVLLFVENLPDAPAGKAYQIWWITDPTKPAPGGTFKTAAGAGELRDQIPEQFAAAQIYAVTLEPEGGSEKPTSTPVLITSVL